MKKFLINTFIALLVGLLPAKAAIARTYPDALAKAGKHPIVIFIYGANYDKVGQKAHEEFVKKNKISPFIKQATFLEMPLYQQPNEREKKDMEKRLGNKRLPGGIWSYPCLAVVDSGGNLRAVVQKPEEMKDPEVALAALKVHLDNFYKQEKILERARKAKGDRKADHLLEAADIDIAMPGNILGKNADGDAGLGNRVSYDPTSLVEALQIMSFDEANAHVRKMMAQGGYSKLQRQMMMAAYAGHLRRGGEKKQTASKERLRALYTEMRNIDPKSTYGAYAEGALVIWVEGGTLTDEAVPAEINRVGNMPDDGNSSGSGSSNDSGNGSGSGSGGSGGRTAMGDTQISGDDAGAVDADFADSEEEDEGDDF
ncbi:MAG: hypothetical protein IKV13_04030 [Akkermansia sp.]|nr:hypothetical protein [Akkermansia sp.]